MVDQIVITEKTSQAKDDTPGRGPSVRTPRTWGCCAGMEAVVTDTPRPEGLSARARRQAETRPPSSKSFARPFAPPSGFGSPPIAIAKVS